MRPASIMVLGEIFFGIGARKILANEDLNNKLESGTYLCQSGSTAKTIANTPVVPSVGFFIINFRLWDNQGYMTQFYIGGGKVYFRHSGASAVGFGSWIEL